MNSAGVSIRLPCPRTNVHFTPTRPKPIPKTNDKLSQDKFDHLPMINTPPSEFMEQLKKRLNVY